MGASKYRLSKSKKNRIKFDQILLEKNTKTGEQWIHISVRNSLGQQRGEIKVMNV